MTNFSSISENYKRITENIENALLLAGRKDRVELMAVTKNVIAEKINYVGSLGVKLIGENRVQEFLEKSILYSENFTIHFIGGLQNNKVKYIINKVKVIESVDNFKLIDEINKRSKTHEIITDILIEINVGGEESKCGIKPFELNKYMDYISELKNIRVKGIMSIPPVPFNGKNDKCFYKMQTLYMDNKDKHGFDTLSMGMSNDYENAIKYGSNLVRIGTALFGNR